MTPKSPEKSLIKGQFHKRMQSLQNTDTRSEFLNYVESRSPERPLRASFSDQSAKPPEKAVKSEMSPNQQSSDDLPNVLISNRYLSRPLFGESTPASATMLALQNMQLPPQEASRTNGPDASSEPKASQPNSFDFLSNQILSLTDIASSLQREMAQLSRRSKDNATDLISLKAATNARDEDIRKSLRDLSSNLAAKFLDADTATRWDLSALLGSENAINQTEPDSSPNYKKSYSGPRMQSPSPFPMEREYCASPGPLTDGSASIALLEKVLREMATKEGQEKLLELMDELKTRPVSDDSSKNGDNSMTEMLEEILNIVKQDSGARALVRAGKQEQDLESNMGVIRQQQSPVTDEMLEIMKRVRSSVIEGGGMTNEVKHLVRELRGEVLGMGRNIASRLEDAERARAIENAPKGPGPEEIAQIVEHGLQELRDQLAAIMNDSKKQSATLSEVRAAMNSTEICSVVKKALDESGMAELRDRPEGARMDKEDILEAVREAWETYKPEIELQNFGLERDEILECLTEGLKAYQPQHEQAATYDQVLAAVQAGVQQFEQPPSITKDEIIQVIQESIENVEPRSLDGEQLAALRDEILNAVTDSIATQTTMKKDEIIQGIQESLESSEARPLDGEQLAALRDEILNSVSEAIATQTALTKDEIIEGIKGCLENSQPRGLDGEQLAAIRDEVLHAVTESMASQSALTRDSFDSGLGRDEILSAVSDGIEAHMLAAKELNQPGITKEDVTSIVNDAFSAQQSALTITSAQPVISRDEILQAISEGLESQNSIPREIELNKEDLMEAITAGLNEVTANANQGLGDQIVERLQQQFEGLKEEVKPQPAATDANLEEILNTIKDSIAVVRQDVEGYATTASEASGKYEILDTVKEGFRLLQADLEKTITENALATRAGGYPDTPELLDAMEKEFEHLRQTLSSLLRSNPASDKEEILDAIRDISENHKPANQENVYELIRRDFENLRESLTMSLVPAEPKSDKDDIVAAVRATLEAFHEEKGQARNIPDKDEIIAAVQATLETFHAENSQTIVPAEPKSDKDDIVAAVRSTLEAFHEEKGQAKESLDKDDILAAIQATLETFHEEQDQNKNGVDKDEIIAAVQATLEAFHEEKYRAKDGFEKEEFLSTIKEISESHKASSDESVSKIVKQEFESLRDSLTMSLVPAEQKNDKDDILAAVQAALELFHAEKGEAKDRAEELSTAELRDALHDGVGIIKEDLAKLLERPVEFNYAELLDTLKEGLSGLKAELEMIRQAQAESEDSSNSKGRELILADEASKASDIEGLKALISQIQVKVDAIEAAPRAPDLPVNLLKKEDMDEVLAGLHELQTSVTEIASREKPTDANVAQKEDTDTIETLLRKTKSQLDEMVFPAPDEIARAEQLGTLEEIVKDTKDVVAEIYGRLEADVPTKTEIGTLETLLKDMWIALDESKGKEGGKDMEDGAEMAAEAEAEKLVKADLQTVEAMIFEVKTQVEELKLPDVETLPTKSEIQNIATLMTEFKEKVEAGQELTGQGFEARKIEHAGLAEKIDEARTVVEGLGEELKSKLDGSHEGLSELKQLLEGLAASSERFTTVENVKELTELINREFERARGEQDAAKLESEERDAAALIKYDETRTAIVVELGAKIDEKLGEVMTKYDEARSSIDTKFAEAAERGNAHLEAVTDTKSLAEDIKLVIGSMGDSVNEACERMSADAKTFFEKVDVSYSKMEEMHNEVKTQQELSRSDVERAAAATERVESKLHEFHPQVLESIQEILSIVGQHYNHTQQATQDLRMDLSVIPTTMTKMLPALPPPEPEKYDDSQVHEKLDSLIERSMDKQVQESLNTLIERVTKDQVHEKLDQLLSKTTSTNGEIYMKLNELLEHATNSNGPIHEKLDTLIGHATNTEQSVHQMMKLDEMHKDIMETSRKMNEMMAAQTALIAEDTERRRKEAEEAAIVLERRTAQREQIEAEILNLKDEKDSMLAMMQRLKAEKDELVAQNAKLHKEVSALETALELRHEEMQVMEERADSLEKRILEGVLDHARTVLLSRPNSTHGLNMKKVRSARGRNVSASSTASTAKDGRSVLGSSLGLALKKRAPPASQTGSTTASTASKERRILSLSHVTGNRGLADRQSGTSGGLTSLKRSQSVKSNYSYRKHSWGGRSSIANKENEGFPEVFPEEDENQSGDESDTGTERRTSYTGTYAESMTYGPGSVISTNRQVSTASTRNLESVADVAEEEDRETAKDEHEEPDKEDEAQSSKADEPEDYAADSQETLDEETSKMVLYGHPADSGLGSEITSTAG
jgi:predicted RNase H-like nuclease